MSVFSKVPKHRYSLSRYDLSYSNKASMNTGLIYPFYAEEVVPGDIFRFGTGVVVRSQPMIAPLFTNYYVEMRYFYVPNRILWDKWQEFLMDQVKGKAALAKPMVKNPYIYFDGDQPSTYATGTIYDFFGKPANHAPVENALPFRAYNLIWNEYFRDQNLQDEVDTHFDDAYENFGEYRLLRVNWRKDYFTSGLPWTQRGDSVALPANVVLNGPLPAVGDEYYQKVVIPSVDAQGNPVYVPAQYGVTGSSAYAGVLRSISPEEIGTYAGDAGTHAGGALAYNSVTNTSGASQSTSSFAYLDPNGTLGVNLDIRDLRFATAVQKFLEREALVGGGRYADYIRGVFGVNIGDASLQRPLYLGGGRQPVNVSPVEQSSASVSGVTPQGNLAGKGYLSCMFHCNRPTLFAEHGWIIGLMYIRPEALYWRGMNRHLIKRDRYDYYIPGFDRIGEQEILNQEVYQIDPNWVGDDDAALYNMGTFAYQSRQAEYKSHPGEVHGEFRTNLRQYVLSRGFTDNLTEPIPLNSDFIECNPDESNVFAVTPQVADSWLVDGRNVCIADRPIKKYPAYGL